MTLLNHVKHQLRFLKIRCMFEVLKDHKKISLSIYKIISLFLSVMFLMYAAPIGAQLRSSTSLVLSPSTFELRPGDSIILIVTLTSNDKPLADKLITFAAYNIRCYCGRH